MRQLRKLRHRKKVLENFRRFIFQERCVRTIGFQYFLVPLYKSRLLSDDLNSLGFERRLTMHPNGNIYMSHMISLIPRGMDRLEERLEKMRIFCQILHERLKKAASKSQGSSDNN